MGKVFLLTELELQRLLSDKAILDEIEDADISETKEFKDACERYHPFNKISTDPYKAVTINGF